MYLAAVLERKCELDQQTVTAMFDKTGNFSYRTAGQRAVLYINTRAISVSILRDALDNLPMHNTLQSICKLANISSISGIAQYNWNFQ
jgi:hypothetical protein